MPNIVSILRNNFSAGEIGPHVMGRTEIPAYLNGCKRLENYFPTKIGGSRRRPGTYYIGAVYLNASSRLVPWILTDGTFLILEITGSLVRFLKEDNTFLASPTSTPYLTADLPGLRFANVKGELWIVHPLYAPRRMVYNSGTVTLVTVSFTTSTGITFAGTGNYPASVAFYAGRLWFGGTVNIPRGIWASRTYDPSSKNDRFEYFTTKNADDSVTADCAIYIVETGIGASPFRWLEPLFKLVGGSINSIWQESGSAPIPGSFDMRLAVANGTAAIQAKALGSYVIYVGADGRSLFALSYSEEAGGFRSIELSFSSRHLLTAGIKEMDVGQVPEQIIYVVTNDGQFLTYHLDEGAGVAGFACHPFSDDAIAESVCVARKGLYDAAYLVVNRAGIRLIEFIDPSEYASVGPLDDSDEPGGMHYVDSGIYIKGSSPALTFSGLSWLEGKTVHALGDGGVMPPGVVTGGAITFDHAVTRVHIGLPMTSILQPTSPEIAINGTGQAQRRRINNLVVRMVDSYGGKIGRVMTALQLLPDFVYGVTIYGAPPVLFSGDKEGAFPGEYEEELQILVVQDEPLPLNVIALIYRIQVG